MLTVKPHWKGKDSYIVHGEGVDATVRYRPIPHGRPWITIQGKGQRTHRVEIEEAVIKFREAGRQAMVTNQCEKKERK